MNTQLGWSIWLIGTILVVGIIAGLHVGLPLGTRKPKILLVFSVLFLLAAIFFSIHVLFFNPEKPELLLFSGIAALGAIGNLWMFLKKRKTKKAL